MYFQKPEMFVRNSAQRNSLSERMKGLGRDVKKKIAARLKSSRSKEEDVSAQSAVLMIRAEGGGHRNIRK